jgi:hypothetical protein
MKTRLPVVSETMAARSGTFSSVPASVGALTIKPPDVTGPGKAKITGARRSIDSATTETYLET